jgi:hypothetical protein
MQENLCYNHLKESSDEVCMKINDVIWIILIIGFSMILVVPETRIIFNDYTLRFPYLMGFIKTAYLATMGEMLVFRMKTGSYVLGKTLWMKFIVWGLLGMVFVFIFKIFASGVISAQSVSLLPSIEGNGFLSKLLTAFFISLMMNVFFAPTFMFFHKITDGYIDQSGGNIHRLFQIPLSQVIETIQLKHFVSFVVLKTIPLFWIPAHTITFLLPEQYRIVMAAYLSIALGFLLTISNKRVHQSQ